jgi:lipopolysaccharide export system permease protein
MATRTDLLIGLHLLDAWGFTERWYQKSTPRGNSFRKKKFTLFTDYVTIIRSSACKGREALLPKLIEGYIRREIFPPFLLALLVFTLVLFMQRALEFSDMIVARGVNAVHLLRLIGYSLPSLLWLAIPMAFLMGALSAMGRLSADNEIVAMHSVGIGFSSFLRPMVQLGILLFCVTFAVGALAVPWGNTSMRSLILRMFEENTFAGIETRTFNDRFTDLVIYAGQTRGDGRVLEQLMISDYRSPLPETILATRGEIESHPTTFEKTFNLTNGAVHQYDPQLSRYRLIHFQHYKLSLRSKSEAAQRHFLRSADKPEAMRLGELKTAAAGANTREAREWGIHYHERFALPFSCVIFGLFSIPLGIRFKRSGKFIGFTASLLVVFLYYILLGAGRKFGSEGLLAPPLAAWLPNAFFGLWSLHLLRRVARKIPEDSARLGAGVGQLWERIARYIRRGRFSANRS